VRICLLSDEVSEDFDPSPCMTGFDWEMVTLTAPVGDRILTLAESGQFDVFLNLCEGYEPDQVVEGGPGYRGIEVIEALERTDMPFTGADSQCYDPTREEQQAVAQAYGIGFVKGHQVRSVEQAVELVQGLRYPIMVKHPRSYGSTGMFRDSRADYLDQVKHQVARVCSRYGAARMEEFIVGKEYNVLIVDNADELTRPFAYPPAELVFPPDEEFWHTDVKWNYSVPFSYRQVVEPGLAALLQDAGRRMFLAMGMSGYGRCDLRMNEAGEVWMLEINPNPGIMFPLEEFGPADYMILYDRDGYGGFLQRILQAALVRHRLRRVKALP
jgi:D-alanine-D-alanine ligase